MASSSRVVLLLAMCVLPAMVAAIRPAKNPFIVKGSVFCDPCRFDYESSASTNIAGAEVELQCKDKLGQNVVYTKKGWTNENGEYAIPVNEDHEDQICSAKLISSPQNHCNEAIPGREEARVILTAYNGIASNNRFANAMGFRTQDVGAPCAEILRQYQEFDNEN